MYRKVEIGKVYRQISGDNVLALRDVPRHELRVFTDPAYEYVEVVNAEMPDQSCGWRRKHDGKHPLYAERQHPNHLILEV